MNDSIQTDCTIDLDKLHFIWRLDYRLKLIYDTDASTSKGFKSNSKTIILLLLPSQACIPDTFFIKFEDKDVKANTRKIIQFKLSVSTIKTILAYYFSFFRLKPIFAKDSAASKNIAHLMRGQKWLKNDNTFIKIESESLIHSVQWALNIMETFKFTNCPQKVVYFRKNQSLNLFRMKGHMAQIDEGPEESDMSGDFNNPSREDPFGKKSAAEMLERRIELVETDDCTSIDTSVKPEDQVLWAYTYMSRGWWLEFSLKATTHLRPPLSHPGGIKFCIFWSILRKKGKFFILRTHEICTNFFAPHPHNFGLGSWNI